MTRGSRLLASRSTAEQPERGEGEILAKAVVAWRLV